MDRPRQSQGDAKVTLPTVLVVEDSPDDYFLLERAFRKAGVEATLQWAKDGNEAKRLLETLIPFCVLADLKMPLMDGFALLEYVRSRQTLNAVPFIVLTNSSSERDIARAFEAGANSYVVKPSSFDSLVQISSAFHNWWMLCNARGQASRIAH